MSEEDKKKRKIITPEIKADLQTLGHEIKERSIDKMCQMYTAQEGAIRYYHKGAFFCLAVSAGGLMQNKELYGDPSSNLGCLGVMAFPLYRITYSICDSYLRWAIGGTGAQALMFPTEKVQSGRLEQYVETTESNDVEVPNETLEILNRETFPTQSEETVLPFPEQKGPLRFPTTEEERKKYIE
jgi:hypothetical protein